jgi:hypothetical protein
MNMNCTLSLRTSIELDTPCSIHVDLPSATPLQNDYSTTPMPALTISRLPDEEELYTSFEAAISQRASAIQERLHRMQSLKLPDTGSLLPDPSISGVRPSARLFKGKRPWQRYIVFIALALMFTLLGFDLMGLLVLSLH